MLLNQGANIRPLDVLEDDVVQAPVLAAVINPSNSLVIQPRGRFRLVAKAGQGVGIGRLGWREHFQGDSPPQLLVEGPEDPPHSTATDVLDQLEVIQPIAWSDRALKDSGNRIALGSDWQWFPPGNDRFVVGLDGWCADCRGTDGG